MPVPKYDDLFDPLLRAMHELGGSASVAEQEDKVAALLRLSEKDLSEIHRGNRTKFSYRLAWARNYLKRYGLLENSSRGVWALTAEGLKRTTANKSEVKKVVQSRKRKTMQVLSLPSPNQKAKRLHGRMSFWRFSGRYRLLLLSDSANVYSEKPVLFT